MLKKFGAVCLAAVLLLTGCTLRPQENGSKVQSISRPAVESAELQFTHPVAGDTVAVFDTSAGVFRAVLFPEKAPQACDNFIGLVQQGYYNGLTVSRVENQFVVEAGQGADGKGSTIWKGSRYPVEASDSLHHYAGALCMGVDASGECASVFYVVQTLPGEQSVTQELVEDCLLGTMKQRANKLVTAYGRTREKFGRILYAGGLYGTTVSYKGKTFACGSADGQALFSKTHPNKVNGAKQTNLYKGTFTNTLLGKIETEMQNIKGDNGELLGVAPDTIWIPNDAALKDAVFSAVGADKEPTSGNNAFNYQFGRWNIIVDPYLTAALTDLGESSEKPFFLLDSKFIELNDGPIFQDRVPLDVKSVIDNNNDNNVWQGRARFGAGFADWRFVAVGNMSTGTDLT